MKKKIILYLGACNHNQHSNQDYKSQISFSFTKIHSHESLFRTYTCFLTVRLELSRTWHPSVVQPNSATYPANKHKKKTIKSRCRDNPLSWNDQVPLNQSRCRDQVALNQFDPINSQKNSKKHIYSNCKLQTFKAEKTNPNSKPKKRSHLEIINKACSILLVKS